jgi:hypothetical protein
MPKGTVLLGCAGSIGQSAIIDVPGYANQKFYGSVYNLKMTIPTFLCYKLNRYQRKQY